MQLIKEIISLIVFICFLIGASLFMWVVHPKKCLNKVCKEAKKYMKVNKLFTAVVTVSFLYIVVANFWPGQAEDLNSANAKGLSEMIYGDVKVDRIYSVYDADTFRADIDKWPLVIGHHIPIRINGIDAPEIRGKCQAEKNKAKLARAFTLNTLTNAQTIELGNIKRGKYFRILADVYVDNKNLAQMLIKVGHARAYDGGKRQGWCE